MTSQKLITMITLSTLLIFTGCGSESNKLQVQPLPQMNIPDPSYIQIMDLSTALAALPLEELTDEESADILFMREEEKLARDAYDFFYNLWGQQIFNNISNSEQTHMEALLLLINRYDLIDPVADDIPGYFPNTDLQSLYDLLTASGSNSLIDALMAGAEIEEVDLIDLYIRYDATDNQDVRLVYDNLMKGSRNHLRSFVSNLEKQGVTYLPLHLTQEEYDEIINSPMENGRGS